MCEVYSAIISIYVLCFAPVFFLIYRKPKIKKTKKTKKTKEEQDQQNAPKKKKGFLPETKKRSNRKKQVPVSEKGAVATSDYPEGGEEGQEKNKKKNKKRKQPGGRETPAQPSPAKKAKTQPTSQPKKKKKKKQQGGGE